MSDQMILICKPTAKATERTAGSTDGWCEVCATRICIAATSQHLIEQGATTLCTDCGMAMAEQLGGELQPPTEAQLAELEAHGVPRAQVFATYNQIKEAGG